MSLKFRGKSTTLTIYSMYVTEQHRHIQGGFDDNQCAYMEYSYVETMMRMSRWIQFARKLYEKADDVHFHESQQKMKKNRKKSTSGSLFKSQSTWVETKTAWKFPMEIFFIEGFFGFVASYFLLNWRIFRQNSIQTSFSMWIDSNASIFDHFFDSKAKKIPLKIGNIYLLLKKLKEKLHLFSIPTFFLLIFFLLRFLYANWARNSVSASIYRWFFMQMCECRCIEWLEDALCFLLLVSWFVRMWSEIFDLKKICAENR